MEIRSPRRTFVVLCEGERTEPEYFSALRRDRLIREVSAVDLRIETESAGAVPLTLVRAAIAAKRKAVAEEKEIDEFWCVFDVECPRNHPFLKQALNLAREHDIFVAVSNPCFEVWLALHFHGFTAWLDNDAARRLRREYDGQLGKGLDGARYMPRRRAAAQRAADLDRRHVLNGTEFPHDNPSSGMHRLLAAIEPPIDS